MGGGFGRLAAFFDVRLYWSFQCHPICAMMKKNGVGYLFLPKTGSTRTVVAGDEGESSACRGTSSDVEDEDAPSSKLLPDK